MRRSDLDEFLHKCKTDVLLMGLRPSDQGIIKELDIQYGSVLDGSGQPKEITIKLTLK